MSVRLNSGAKIATVEAPSLAVQDASPSHPIPRRFPFHLVKLAVPAGDFVVILAASILAGIGYHWLALDAVNDLSTFLAVGVLVFANFAALTSAQNNYRVSSLVNLGRQIRYVTFTWWFICFVLLGVAFTLKISGNFSR